MKALSGNIHYNITPNKAIFYIILFCSLIVNSGIGSSFPEIFRNENNSIQSLQLTGMLQGQGFVAKSTNKNQLDNFEFRRIRGGIKVKIKEDTTFVSDLNINDNINNPYNSINDFYFEKILRNSDYTLKIGKAKPIWGSRWSQSVKKLPVFEWGQLTSQLRPDRTPGINIDYNSKNWGLDLGAWSGDIDNEFGDFNQGAFLTFSYVYDLKSLSTTLMREIGFNSYINKAKEESKAIKSYNHAFSLYFRGGYKKIDYTLDFMQGMSDYGSINGVIFETIWNINKEWSLVGEYQYSESHSGEKIELENRYFKQVSTPLFTNQINGYSSNYIGLTHKINNDKFKIMFGLKYEKTDGFANSKCFTILNGFRIYF